jgi:flagellar hook assembly protein FlgD
LIPDQFAVYQNYPNPFNPSTIITYALPQASKVTIVIYDMLGREVKTLVDNYETPGNHQIVWNGDNNFGAKVASGAYIYRVVAGNFVATKKMVLLK